ncbi:MAG TPA: hypothetical protein VJG48_03485, partial [Candidatus Paceibacterota bacterium]
PAGLLSITDTFGRRVLSEQVGPIVILPEGVRSQTLSVNIGYVPGRYTASLQIEDGFGGHHEERGLTLWIFPWQTILTLVVVIVVFLLWQKAKKL